MVTGPSRKAKRAALENAGELPIDPNLCCSPQADLILSSLE